MNTPSRNPWLVLFSGCLWIGLSAEARSQTIVSVNFQSNDKTTITNGTFSYLESHGVSATTATQGQFKFFQSADDHTLNYTFKSGSSSLLEGCAGNSCNIKYDMFTNYAQTPKALHLDVEWSVGVNKYIDFIDIVTLTTLDPKSLPLCGAFESGTTYATGTFTRNCDGVVSAPIPITVTSASCAKAAVGPVLTCPPPPPPPVVCVPVYLPPARRVCRLGGLFACHPFRRGCR